MPGAVVLSRESDYVAPGLKVVRPDAAFPRMRALDRSTHPWKFLRREVPHLWYADERFPLMGFVNRDEATILHNIALAFAGRSALELGTWLGWSTCHLALAGVTVDSIDPAHEDPEHRAIVQQSLALAGVADRVNLIPGRSPGAVGRLATKHQRKWSLFFIDGDHERDAPVCDVRTCLPHAARDCAFVFHDLASPDVAAGLRFLQRQGWKVVVFQTAQIMGMAWRGRVSPPAHVPDPEVLWQLPHHLVGLPVAGVDFDHLGQVAEPFADLRDLVPADAGGERPSICIVSNEIIGPFKNGGIGTSMTGLAERMAAAGFPVTILYTGNLTSPDAGLGGWQARYAEMGIDLVALEAEGLGALAGPLRDIGFGVPALVYKYLTAHAFDVVHFNDCLGEGSLCLAAKRLGLAFPRSLLVLALHSPSQWVLELNQTLPTSLLYAAMNHAERLSVRCADVLWSPSRYLLGWARDRGFALPARTFVQPYALPTQRLREGAPSPSPSPAVTHGRAASPREIVFFGRLEERKGLRLFCNAIHRLRDELAERQITVTFLGKVQPFGAMNSLDYIAQRSAGWRFPVKTITDLGQPEALAYLLGSGRLAVMPPPFDNSPCTVYEALDAGIPFLAARTGGIPELIDAADHDHVLFDCSTEGLRAALRDTLGRGGWIAKPSLAQADIRSQWQQMHAGWRAFLPSPAAEPQRRPVVAIVDHDVGLDLEATLTSLRACAGIRRVVVQNRTGAALPTEGFPLPLRNLDLLSEDPDALADELAGLAADAVLLIHAGTTVRPERFAAMVAALAVDGVDGLVPAALVKDPDGSTKLVPPLGGSPCFSLFEGVTFTGALLVRGDTLVSASEKHAWALAAPFLGLADQCLMGGAEIWPYPEPVLARSAGAPVRSRSAQSGRVAAYAEASSTERYYMLAAAFAPPKEIPHIVPSLPDRAPPAVAARVPEPARPVTQARVTSPPPTNGSAAPEYSRVGPVHFQPLEQELDPVASYLSGHLLNAGCGSRDIRPYLHGKGVTNVTRCDIESADPEVVIGPLESMRFVGETFDSVLCNAVLEHVVDAEKAIRELARVVRPGGHVVVAVPFLQPFHPCPGDFRRYTAAGLAELGSKAGLEVVAVLPVHSIAQTLGWILWEYAQEKGGRLRRAVAWSLAFAATRLSNRTDNTLIKSANTFQAVFRRPDVIGTGWRQTELPAVCKSVPTMLVPDELRLLHHLTEHHYTGAGAIVDGGAFLGGSTVALADGLRQNLKRRGRPEEKLIHSFDRFRVEEWTRPIYFPESMKANDDFRPMFAQNVADYADLIEVHAGEVNRIEWSGEPIEILFIDFAKHWRVCDWVTWQFFRHLIPGRSIVVQQDYLYHWWVAWLHVTMEYYAEYFEYVCDTEVNSVAFLYIKKIPEEVLRRKTVEALSTQEKIELMDRAASRFAGKQRDMMVAAKEHFLEQLREDARQRAARFRNQMPQQPMG